MVGGIWLFLTILIPVTVSVLVVASFAGEGEWGSGRLSSVFSLDTSKGLVHQGWLWLVVIVPLAVAISLGLWEWPSYEFEMSSDGYKKFIEISILPLAVMSLALPLAGLISKFHSTQQTAKQIEVVSFKNNLDAFYTHRKELISYFSAMNPVEYLGVLEFKYDLHPVLHVRFFNGTPEKGWPVANQETFKSVERGILQGAKYLIGVLEAREDRGISDLDCYLQGCKHIYLAAQSLHIREITNHLASKGVLIRSASCDEGVYDLLTIGTTTVEVLAAIRFARSFYDNLCDFSGVPRMEIPEGQEIVFLGGQRLLAGELKIERLHELEIAAMVLDGWARYDENHPVNSEAT
ncbi:hypothetical protein [Pseudomonas sp. GL-RE-26]|uniref:hypothetical protein n=1 Tax=Pseudomonas sp. GL-RE-26 TaxID=2832390 RepID=UPI001CC16CB6|nr:hypothetical protein [Pseudomonas sp. GL-RE-26]